MAANKRNITLGFFVSAGVLLLVVALYLIGRNRNMFGSTFHLRARFQNVSGLMSGNNIRYSGIQAGTVKEIRMIDDTTIEVDMLIDESMRQFIKTNSMASIGNEGLMGNKVVNITPASVPGEEIEEGALLVSKIVPGTDEMMGTLSNTNENVEELSIRLVNTVNRINNSKALWRILDDTTLSDGLRTSMLNLQAATTNLNIMSAEFAALVHDVRLGEGALGAVISNDTVASDLKEAVANIKLVSEESIKVLLRVDSMVAETKSDLQNGDGIANKILNDTALVTKVNSSLESIERGTSSFEQSMEALKHNVLLRGYFRRNAKKQNGKQKR